MRHTPHRITNSFPGGNILPDKFVPSGGLSVKKLQTGLERLSKIVSRVSHKELVLKVFQSNSRWQGGLVLLCVKLNESSLVARHPRENVDNFLGGIVLGSGQNLVVFQFTLVLKSGFHEETFIR